MKLYPFQEMGVSWLKGRKTALLADEMGLGKTVQAIVAARECSGDASAQHALIVCPASLKYVWERMIKTWDNPGAIVQIVSSGKDRIYFARWTIINYDLLLKKEIFMQLLNRKFNFGIFDEAHYLKNTESKRTKLVLLRGGLASRCNHIWFLTGTPILNRPIELWPILKAAAPEVIHPFTNYIGYAKYFCGGYYDGISFNDRGSSHVDELNGRLTKSGFMLRRLKSAVLTELPDKTFEIIPVDVAHKPGFEFLWQKDDVTKTNFGDYFNKDDPGALGQVAEARRYIGLEKIKTVVPHIKALLLEKEKVVVFAHHREVVDILMKELADYNPVKIMGGMSAKDKNDSEYTFQHSRDCRVFIGNILAAGVGITLTASDTAVFAELDWVPGNLIQASDRIHRIGQKNACLIQMFVTRDSIEEYMLRRLVEKKDVCERVLKSEDDIYS